MQTLITFVLQVWLGCIFVWPMELFYAIKSFTVDRVKAWEASTWLTIYFYGYCIVTVLFLILAAFGQWGTSFMHVLFVSSVGLNLLHYVCTRLNKNDDTTHMRGRRKATPQEVKRAGDELGLMFKAGQLPVHVGNIALPASSEPLGLLFSGSPGSGKSQGINAVALIVRDRGQPAIVADPQGTLTEAFYTEGRDVILNPLDARSVAWSPLAEVRGPADFARLARAIIPDGDGSDKEWQGYGQKLVAAVLQRIHEKGGTNADLMHALTVADDKELGAMVAGLAASQLFSEGAARMLASVRAIVGTQLEAWAFLDPQAGRNSWSVRAWVEGAEKEGDSPWLFLNYRADERALLRPLLGAWLDLATQSVMSLAPKRERRFWFFIDELPALRKVSSLPEALAEGRKFGICAVAGIQTKAQLVQTYGRETSTSLLACFQTVAILRTVDAETADQMSRTTGEREIERTKISESQGTKSDSFDTSSNRSTSTEHRQERVLLASELQSLADLEGWLVQPGIDPIFPVVCHITELPKSAAPFVTKAMQGAISVSAPMVAKPAPAGPTSGGQPISMDDL